MLRNLREMEVSESSVRYIQYFWTRPKCNGAPDKRLGRSLGGFARDSRETAKRTIGTLVRQFFLALQ
jgi:hypothetical protein